MTKNRVLVCAAAIAASAGLAQAQSFSEAFDDITTLPGSGWFQQNNSNPLGVLNWEQGDAIVFPAQASAGYIFSDYLNGEGAATISSWLVTPNRVLNNGDTFAFWTRTVSIVGFPDRMQVRMSTAGAGTNVGALGDPNAVGDFTTLLLDINPNYSFTDYPSVWTQYNIVLSGLPAGGVSGRLAFRYFVEDGGPGGNNSDYIGVDEVAYTSNPSSAVGACCLPATLSCVIASQANCLSQSGTYRGDGTVCGECPTPGACCLAQGACVQVTAAACSAQTGVYRGDSTSCAAAACPGGFSVICTIPGTFTDISATGTPLTFENSLDDDTAPFTSTVTNALVANPNLFACTNGNISDTATFVDFGNTTLPNTAAGIGFGLFPNWDDLILSAPASVVHQALVEGGVPVHIIQWTQAAAFFNPTGPRGNFQVKIFGPGGPALVQYLYQDMAWDFNGNSSTVGVQWTATAAHQKSFGNTNAAPTPPGPIPNNAVCSVIQNGANVCYANCDSSTNMPCLNVLDFTCFLNKFAAQDAFANCDQSTNPPLLNVLDFTCFLNKFAASCSSC